MKHTWVTELTDPAMIETAWERQMQFAGLEQYEASRFRENSKGELVAKKDASGTAGGKSIIRKLIGKATAAIEELQKELIGTDRTGRNLKATIVGIPADTLALITLSAMIDMTYTSASPTLGVRWQGAAKSIGKSCETEMNFRHWVNTSRAAAKEYAKAKGMTSTPPSLADRMLAEHGSNRGQIARWRKTISELSEYQWEIEETHFCGDALMTAVVKALPESFEIQYLARATSNTKWLRMTDTCRAKFDQTEFRAASSRIVRKPMLTKPRRWVAQ